MPYVKASPQLVVAVHDQTLEESTVQPQECFGNLFSTEPGVFDSSTSVSSAEPSYTVHTPQHTHEQLQPTLLKMLYLRMIRILHAYYPCGPYCDMHNNIYITLYYIVGSHFARVQGRATPPLTSTSTPLYHDGKI